MASPNRQRNWTFNSKLFTFSSCTLEPCQESFKMTELLSVSWEQFAVDFKGPLPSGEYLLVVTDEYSKSVEIEITISTSMKPISKPDEVLSSLVYLWKLKVTMVHFSKCSQICKIFRVYSSANYTCVAPSKRFSWKL